MYLIKFLLSLVKIKDKLGKVDNVLNNLKIF